MPFRIPVPPAPKATPVVIHKQACANCPSAHFPHDPEVEDILTWPRHLQIASVFPCAWRPEKLCKGYCDTLGVTEKDLEEVPLMLPRSA